jgi:hypothetical protein
VFVADSVTLQDVADTLQQAGVSILAAFWTNVNLRSHAWAYRLIVTALTQRGYTLAQVTASDQGSDLERDLTLWKNLCAGAAGQNLAKEFIDTFDRRAELTGDKVKGIKPVVLTVSGAVVEPAGTSGLVTTGAFDTTTDLFAEDPDDTRRGEVTRF